MGIDKQLIEAQLLAAKQEAIKVLLSLAQDRDLDPQLRFAAATALITVSDNS